jgi:hypothetical protein
LSAYVIERMSRRVADATLVLKNFIHERLEEFAERQKLGLPRLAFLGHGRCGKDLAGKYLAQKLGWRYGGASSDILKEYVAILVDKPVKDVWAERHQNRPFWIAAGHAIREHDLTLLCRMALSLSDFAIGLRGCQEVHTCIATGVVQLAIWIDNDRVPEDPTVEFSMKDCDITVTNHGSKFDFYRKLDRLSDVLKLPTIPKE